MDDRLILTFATGKPIYAKMAKALAISLDLQDCKIPRAVVSDIDDPELHELFDFVIPPVEKFDHWFIKLSGLEVTSADRILFVDADCLAVKPLEPAFELFKGSDFAVQGLWSNGIPWYGDMASAMKQQGFERIPMFSAGQLYYERNDRVILLIEKILEYSKQYDSFGLQRNGGKVVDEVCISFAMASLGIGQVFDGSQPVCLTPWGLMGPVHLDVLNGECHFIKGSKTPKFLRPMVYHSATAPFDYKYWREVGKLFKLRKLSKSIGADPMGLTTKFWHFKRLRTLLTQRLIP